MRHCFRIFGLISLISAAFFCACNNQDQAASVSGISPSNDSAAADYQKLDTALSFAGLWVNEKYVNGLRKTKSPSSMEIPEYSCILIPARTLMETTFIEGFHEGSASLIIFKHGNEYEFWDKEAKKKFTDIKFVEGNRMKIGQEFLIRLRSGDLVNDPNPYNIVDLVLFKGKFRGGDGRTVEFTEDGKVKGLAGVNFYEATLDYATAEPLLDELKLGSDMNDLKSYAFRFDHDTLNVFEVICKEMSKDSVCLEAAFGKKQLTLIREK